MKILYIGAGFVGACSAAVAADSGHTVLVFDINNTRIDKLGSGDRDLIESCLFEKGLGDLLVRHSPRINFTTDYAKVNEFLNDCDAVFMCLPTPEIGETGESDLSYYVDAAQKLGESLIMRNNGLQDKYVVVVNKSTVPIDMVDETEKMLKAAGVSNFGVVANPEFLVEGKAIEGSLKPDRVVVGAENEKDFKIMREIYRRFFESEDVKYIEVNGKEAAAGKLLANFYLFHKLITCFDVIGRTCESYADLKFENVRKILTSDKRIGNWGFYNSLYAGGSCLIKDARSLSFQLKNNGKDAKMVDEVYLANQRQLNNFLNRPESEIDYNWIDKKVAVLGAAFKRDTNDIRNSPSIEIVNFLLDHQVKEIGIYDPVALENFKQVFPESENIKYYTHEFDAVKNCDALIIVTDWPQFRGLADTIIGELKNRPLIMDGRRMLQHRYNDLHQAGFNIIAVGSPLLRI